MFQFVCVLYIIYSFKAEAMRNNNNNGLMNDGNNTILNGNNNNNNNNILMNGGNSSNSSNNSINSSNNDTSSNGNNNSNNSNNPDTSNNGNNNNNIWMNGGNNDNNDDILMNGDSNNNNNNDTCSNGNNTWMSGGNNNNNTSRNSSIRMNNSNNSMNSDNVNNCNNGDISMMGIPILGAEKNWKKHKTFDCEEKISNPDLVNMNRMTISKGLNIIQNGNPRAKNLRQVSSGSYFANIATKMNFKAMPIPRLNDQGPYKAPPIPLIPRTRAPPPPPPPPANTKFGNVQNGSYGAIDLTRDLLSAAPQSRQSASVRSNKRPLQQHVQGGNPHKKRRYNNNSNNNRNNNLHSLNKCADTLQKSKQKKKVNQREKKKQNASSRAFVRKQAYAKQAQEIVDEFKRTGSLPPEDELKILNYIPVKDLKEMMKSVKKFIWRGNLGRRKVGTKRYKKDGKIKERPVYETVTSITKAKKRELVDFFKDLATQPPCGLTMWFKSPDDNNYDDDNNDDDDNDDEDNDDECFFDSNESNYSDCDSDSDSDSDSD